MQSSSRSIFPLSVYYISQLEARLELPMPTDAANKVFIKISKCLLANSLHENDRQMCFLILSCKSF